MSYKLNKTNGDLLVELQDGVIDTVSTDITLVGRNYKGFGEFINENYIKLLENFSSTSAPSQPLKGQLWFDSQDERLKLYNGSEFRVAGGPIVSASQPTNMVQGDLWIDNEQNKLYFFDGSDLVLVGPSYSAAQGKTGYEAVTMIDTSGQVRAILAQYIQGVLVGIHSKSQFTPRTADALLPYPVGRIINVGFNPLYATTNGDNIAYKWHGTAISAEALIDDQGNSFSAIDFVRTNERDSQNLIVDQQMEGALFVKGANGLQVGYGDTLYGTFKTLATETKTVIDIEEQNRDFAIRYKFGNDKLDALTLDTSTKRFGLFQNTPTTTLDVTGDGRFTGDLTVEGNFIVTGTSTSVDVVSLRVSDPSLNLGVSEDSTELTDAQVDGGGIILNSLNGSKEITWSVSSGAWTFNQDVDLNTGKEYRIGNSQVLSLTKLGDTVTTANGLTSIGTLNLLRVAGDGQFDSISSAGALDINSTGVITINNQRVTGVDTPVDTTDVTNKSYVDTNILTTPIALTLDITGFVTPQAPGAGSGPITDVKNVIESIYAASAAANGKVARVHCTSYAASTVSGIAISVGVSPDATKTLQKSSVSVDAAGGGTVSVIQDIAATNTASGTVALSPARYTMQFTITGGVWTHNSTVAYP